MLRKLTRKLFTNAKRAPLGRWGMKTEKQKITNALLQSSDNCGDRICGNPNKTKIIISK